MTMHRSKRTHRLKRQTFETSREMDFFSQKELETQTGHGRHEWPLASAPTWHGRRSALDAAAPSQPPASIVRRWPVYPGVLLFQYLPVGNAHNR